WRRVPTASLRVQRRWPCAPRYQQTALAGARYLPKGWGLHSTVTGLSGDTALRSLGDHWVRAVRGGAAAFGRSGLGSRCQEPSVPTMLPGFRDGEPSLRTTPPGFRDGERSVRAMLPGFRDGEPSLHTTPP